MACKLVLIEEVDMGLDRRFRFMIEGLSRKIVVNVGARSLEEAVAKAERIVSKYVKC